MDLLGAGGTLMDDVSVMLLPLGVCVITEHS